MVAHFVELTQSFLQLIKKTMSHSDSKAYWDAVHAAYSKAYDDDIKARMVAYMNKFIQESCSFDEKAYVPRRDLYFAFYQVRMQTCYTLVDELMDFTKWMIATLQSFNHATPLPRMYQKQMIFEGITLKSNPLFIKRLRRTNQVKRGIPKKKEQSAKVIKEKHLKEAFRTKFRNEHFHDELEWIAFRELMGGLRYVWKGLKREELDEEATTRLSMEKLRAFHSKVGKKYA